MSRITVVGCGMMGGNIADAFLDRGHEVTIVDVNYALVEPRVARGARFCESISDALDARFVLFSLPTNQVVRKVLSECSPADLAGLILVNSTSEVPSDVLALEREVCAKGARYVDAAILTYQGEVGGSDACLLYSGDRQAFDEIEDDLRSLSPDPVFIGDDVSVAAEIVDIVVVAGHYGLTYAPLEGIALCAELGIDVDEYLAHLRDLLPELSAHALPKEGLDSFGGASPDGWLRELLETMSAYDLFERLNSRWLSGENRGVAAHFRKLLEIASSNFEY